MDRIRVYRHFHSDQQVERLRQIDKDIAKVLYCLIFAFLGMMILIGVTMSKPAYSMSPSDISHAPYAVEVVIPEYD